MAEAPRYRCPFESPSAGGADNVCSNFVFIVTGDASDLSVQVITLAVVTDDVEFCSEHVWVSGNKHVKSFSFDGPV